MDAAIMNIRWGSAATVFCSNEASDMVSWHRLAFLEAIYKALKLKAEVSPWNMKPARHHVTKLSTMHLGKKLSISVALREHRHM